jgi:hypothetical protein
VALPSLSSNPASSAPNSSTSAGASRTASSDEQVSAEVEAAVRAYFDAVNIAVESGDVAALSAVTASSCTCSELIAEVTRLFRDGQIVGARWTVDALKVDLVSDGIAGASVRYTSRPYVTQDMDGRLTGQFEGHRVEARIELRSAVGAWQVTDVDRIGQSPL